MSAHPDEATWAELAQGMVEGERRATLEAHLEHCADCSALLTSLLRALNDDDDAHPRRGQVFGRFVVLEPIGAGALGEVFSAWDSVLERAVALKRLHPSLFEVDGAALRARLLGEARALAKVQHPHVVNVFDVVPWDDTMALVMELVPHAKTLRQLAAELPWHALTQHYLDAGRGLLAAHAAGVIHRDFKPDNVLLGDGRVRVCDFGLSRAEGPAPAPNGDARRSSISGTPAYLPPERWRGSPASAATDTWALATSLYEGLAGRLPFVEREPTARAEELRRGPPPLPADAARPAALEAALRRALSVDPAARFESLSALLEALDAVLQPRRASPALPLLLAGGVLVLVASALLGVRWKAQCDQAAAPVVGVWNAGRATAVRTAFLATKHPSAAALADTATRALDQLADRLGDVRHRACEATAFQGDSDALLTARTVCVSRRLDDVDALVRSFEKADARTVERAALAVETLGQGAECFDATVVGALQPPPVDRASALANATRQVSEVRALRLVGKTRDSVAAAQGASDTAQALGWKPLMADAESEWSSGLERAGQVDAARAHGQQSLAWALEAGDAARAYSAAVELAFIDGYDANKPDVGRTWLVLARALLTPAKLRDAPDALRADNVEATLLGKQGKHAEAAALWKRVIDGLGDTPSLNLARMETNYGSALREAGQAAEGLVWLERAERRMEGLLGPAHPDLAAATNNLGSALSDLGRFEEARPWFERSLEIRQQLFGPEALPLATTLYNLGELALRTGDGATALRQYGRSRAVVEKARGPDDDDVWDARLGEGNALLTLGRADDARALLEQVLPELVKRQFPPWNVAEAKLGLARALHQLGREPQRVQTLAREVQSLEGPRHDTQRAAAAALLAPH